MSIFKHFGCKVNSLYPTRTENIKKSNRPSTPPSRKSSSFFSFGTAILSAMHQAMSSNNKMTLTQRSIYHRDTER